MEWLLLACLLLACLNVMAAPTADPGELDCIIEPHIIIDLSSRVDGIVETFEVERGELIEKDQVLVRLESSVERAGVAEARARAEASAEILASSVSVEFAQRRNNRMQELYRSQAVSTDRLDEIETENKLSRLQLQQARENKAVATLELRQAVEILKRHTLHSPIRGIVVQHYLSPGEAVEDQPIMRLAQIDPLRVEVIVPVMAFGSIKVGQRAIVNPEAPMQGDFEAKVTIVDGVADAASGTFRVRLSLPNEDYALPSGLKCRVRFLPYTEIPRTQLAGPEPASAEPESATAVSAAPDVAAPVPAVRTAQTDSGAARCRTIGPIKDAPEADRIMAALSGQATRINLREEKQPGADRYIVLSPPQASREDTELLTGKLKAAGFDDFFVYWRGPYKGRVSLGVYRDKAWAEERRAWLADLGIESVLVPGVKNRSRFWLDVKLLPRITALDLASATQSVNRTDLLNETDLTSVSCDDLVAASPKPKSTVAAPKPAVAATVAVPKPKTAPPAPAVRTAKKDPGAAQCRTIGPIRDVPQANRIMAAIGDQAKPIKLREENETSGQEYLIMTAPFESLADARAETEKMTAAGFTDFFIFRRGTFQNRISVGLYKSKTMAEERRALVGGMGVETELMPRGKSRSRFWLDVELLPRLTALDLAPATLAADDSELKSTPCDDLVARKSNATAD